MYCVEAARTELEIDVAFSAITLETIVVFAPADGAAPFELPSEGELGDIALKST